MDGKVSSIPQIILSLKSVSSKIPYQFCTFKYKKQTKIQKTEILASENPKAKIQKTKSSRAEKINFKVSFVISSVEIAAKNQFLVLTEF